MMLSLLAQVGPAGVAAAIKASRMGIQDIIIVERENRLGGILQQCIHNIPAIHFTGETAELPVSGNKKMTKTFRNAIIRT